MSVCAMYSLGYADCSFFLHGEIVLKLLVAPSALELIVCISYFAITILTISYLSVRSNIKLNIWFSYDAKFNINFSNLNWFKVIIIRY